MDLGMARQIDEHSRKPAGVEIRRDRISISRFLDCGAVGQYVNASKTEDLSARPDPVRLPRGALEAPAKMTETARIARRNIRRAELIVITRLFRLSSRNGWRCAAPKGPRSLARGGSSGRAKGEIVRCRRALCTPTRPRNNRPFPNRSSGPPCVVLRAAMSALVPGHGFPSVRSGRARRSRSTRTGSNPLWCPDGLRGGSE